MSKRIISIIVFVLAIAGAGVFVYITATRGGDTGTAGVSAGSSMNNTKILPYGNNLNFETITSFNKDGRLFSYPAVTPSDIGVPLEGMIKQP